MLHRSKDGSTYEPNSTFSIVVGGAMVAIGIVMAAATDIGGVGLGLVGMGLFFAVVGGMAGARFEKAKAAYRKRRARLSVDQFRGSGDDGVTADEIPELK
jgi:hypothetical protein